MPTVYSIPVHVTPTPGSLMPEGMAGAHVRCYCAGENAEAAVVKAVDRLKGDGLAIERIEDSIYRLASEDWAVHVRDNWPEHADALLSQAEFDDAIAHGHVVYGPFAGYNPS